MRRAFSMALAYNQFTRSEAKVRKNAFIITSTITVVLFSTMLQHFSSMTLSEPSSPKSFIVPLLRNGQSPRGNGTEARPSNLRMLLTTPSRTVHYYYYYCKHPNSIINI